MTYYDADTRAPRPPGPLLSWLIPSAAMIAAVLGLAFIAATFGLSHPGDGEGFAAPEIPATGLVTGASLAIGERPFAYLEFDWPPTSGVPGFDPWQHPHRHVADASAR